MTKTADPRSLLVTLLRNKLTSDSFFLAPLVTDRPDPTLDFWDNHCPHCNSTDVDDSEGVIETLVGWSGNWHDGLSHQERLIHPHNPNHAGRGLTCNSCGLHFCKEVKRGNVWVTACAMNQLLAGVPNCFERYTYTCRYCGGFVTRHYTKLDGETPALGRQRGPDPTTGEWVRLYRTFWRCAGCGAELETEQDYGL